MLKPSGFQRLIARDKGVFNGRNFSISTDSVTWIKAYALFITEKGQLYSADENDNNYLLLQYLQSCYVQVIPNINTSNSQPLRTKNRKLGKNSSGDAANNSTNPHDLTPPVVFIKTFDNEKLYIKIPSKNNFGNLLSSLLVWQNLKPKSLVKKWYCENKFNNQLDFIHEVLVCRFKVYGPILNKGKNLNIIKGPKVPNYQKNLNPDVDSNNYSLNQNSLINEGWFYTMGVLKSNGVLNFITELDGTLIYSIDVKNIVSSEIREIHHSIFDNSNVLFLGQIKELRWNNLIKSVSSPINDQVYSLFLMKDGKTINSYNRILIEFPLHIDLEDWFVGLNYFAKREYIGSYNPRSLLSGSTSTNNMVKKLQSLTLNDDLAATVNNDDKETTDSPDVSQNQDISFHMGDSTLGSINPPLLSNTQQTTPPRSQTNGSSSAIEPQLNDYEKEFFRISKKLALDIIEAKFDEPTSTRSKIYAEVVMWGLPWSRTAIVSHTSNPFWKEGFSTDLPISTQIIHILIKKCSFNDSNYLEGDKVIGTVYLTPDILTRHLSNFSTMLIDGNEKGKSINLEGMKTIDNSNSNNDIVRLSIYDSANLPIGKLLVTVNLKEYHILSPKNFKPLENMLLNAPMKDLIDFCNQNVSTSDFDNVSLIMLDIFQSLGIEDKWFKELMDNELINVDKVTRQNYINNSKAKAESDKSKTTAAAAVANGAKASSSNNVFNTLFRGSSIFSKSLEKYNLRIGQEYLEKVFGDFFAIIDQEKKNCEVDPRYVRLQERAERKGKDLDDSDGDDDSDLDSDVDSDEENARDKKVKSMVDENFDNLYNYAEMIWHKIYITSNDLPDQIKSQLKSFRNKVELACDPNDKITALNCLSAFIFLRFFCPAILNPKLFYLTKNHQTGRSQRTLTLIAKILLNLANRQQFSPHKEPHLVKMNSFLDSHKDEVLDYFDKITGRKNDFNEKILELSHEVKRFDLGLSGDSTSSELPTTPYLIDKYLRLTELIYLLDNKESDDFSEDDYEEEEEEEEEEDEGEDEDVEEENDTPNVAPVESATVLNPVSNGTGKSDADEEYDNFDETTAADANFSNRRAKLNGIKEGDIKFKNNVYQIGSLEFEKSEFLDLAGDDETENFIKSLCKSDENIFTFITSNITLKDLQKRSKNLKKRIGDLESFLTNYEYPNNYQSDHMMWDSFTNYILNSSYLDTKRNCVVHLDAYNLEVIPHHYKKLSDHGLTTLKLKFTDDTNVLLNNSSIQNSNPSIRSKSKSKVSESVSDNSLSSVLKSPTTKNPFKKWFNKT